MTNIYFVRHAQPDITWAEDRTRPLTALGMADQKNVTDALEGVEVHAFLSSPYQRSYDTIAHCANSRGMPIHTDERFREREQGAGSGEFLARRWADFDFCEPDGEPLRSVQARNIQALTEALDRYAGQNIVIGTHGTALSTILNHYDPSFACDGFNGIVNSLPYIIRLGFEGRSLTEREEVLRLERGYR